MNHMVDAFKLTNPVFSVSSESLKIYVYDPYDSYAPEMLPFHFKERQRLPLDSQRAVKVVKFTHHMDIGTWWNSRKLQNV